MIWLTLLGLISLAFILVGWTVAVRRMRRFSQEADARRLRAFAQMVEFGEKAKERKKNTPFDEAQGREHRT